MKAEITYKRQFEFFKTTSEYAKRILELKGW